MAPEARERLAQIGIMWAGGLGPARFRRLVGQFGSATTVLEATAEQVAKPSLRLEVEQITALCGLQALLPQITEQIDMLAEQKVAVLCDFESEYPQILRGIPNPPPVLCMVGRLLPIDDPAIAIVGTRSPTTEGYQMAYELARRFAQEGITVVSGLAQGCDTGGHTGALASGGRTVAVLGSGITVIHPRDNVELAWQIAEHGAIISEAPPDAHPSVGRLMARNRLQSGLARGVIVIQSGEQGGAMQTAKNAQRQSRLVYAVRWSQADQKHAGNARLLADYAQPIDSLDQVPAVTRALYLHKQKMQRQQATEATQQRLFDEE